MLSSSSDNIQEVPLTGRVRRRDLAYRDRGEKAGGIPALAAAPRGQAISEVGRAPGIVEGVQGVMASIPIRGARRVSPCARLRSRLEAPEDQAQWKSTPGRDNSRTQAFGDLTPKSSCRRDMADVLDVGADGVWGSFAPSF